MKNYVKCIIDSKCSPEIELDDNFSKKIKEQLKYFTEFYEFVDVIYVSRSEEKIIFYMIYEDEMTLEEIEVEFDLLLHYDLNIPKENLKEVLKYIPSTKDDFLAEIKKIYEEDFILEIFDQDKSNRFFDLVADLDSEKKVPTTEFNDFFDNLTAIKQYDGLDKIIGLDNFKHEIKLLRKYSEIISNINHLDKRRLPLHYIFNIDDGMGINTVLKTFTNNVYTCNLIQKFNYIYFKGELFEDNNGLDSIVTESNGEISVDSDYGVIALNLSEQIDYTSFRLYKFMDLLRKERGKVIFILIVSNKDRKKLKLVLDQITNNINFRTINFPPYSTKELIKISEVIVNKSGFKYDELVIPYLRNRLEKERLNGETHNIDTLKKLIEDVQLQKVISLIDSKEQPQDVNTLFIEDFEKRKNDISSQKKDVLNDINELVGLESIKDKLKEIVTYAKVQSQMSGINTNNNLSYHMVFTGNPGTGKTTVARLLGKIFKSLDILKVGDVVEVSRVDLVGQYIGQTAPKVKDKVNEAIGSILFIDEAYNLYQDSKKDYGSEVISTLIKYMEDRRDNLIVIMAGYPEEMNKLLESNPGLRERIPYKIHFPDYNAKELTDIFFGFFSKEYIYEDGVREKVEKLFELALLNKDKNFANGRLARNLAERLLVKQADRLVKHNLYNQKDLLTINLEDIEKLYTDKEIMSIIKNVEQNKNKVGFKK